MDSQVNTLNRLLAIEEIRQIKARRIRAIDAKDWAAYAALHVDDHISDSYGGSVMRGNEANVSHLSALLAGVFTIHQVHSYEIAFDGDNDASGIWAMEDRLFWTQGGAPHWLHGWGHYHERYRHQQGVWRFSYRRLDRQRVELSPGADMTQRDRPAAG